LLGLTKRTITPQMCDKYVLELALK
jgi:hypothetical protein